jgi:hypothetical protein
MKDREHHDTISLGEKVNRIWEPPHTNSTYQSVHTRIHQRVGLESTKRVFNGRLELAAQSGTLALVPERSVFKVLSGSTPEDESQRHRFRR